MSVDQHSSTYPCSGVALENASVDLDICTLGIDCTTLSIVAFSPPGVGAKKVQESSRTNLELPE
jgi:hypothetical protein